MRYSHDDMLPEQAFSLRCGHLASLEGGGGGKSRSAPPPPPPPPVVDDTAVTQAATDERKRRASAEGRASTMLTQETEGDEPMTAKKKLLGA